MTIPTDNKNGTEPTKLRVKVALDPKCPDRAVLGSRGDQERRFQRARPFVVDSLKLVPSTSANRTKDAASVDAVRSERGRRCRSVGLLQGEGEREPEAHRSRVLARRIGSPLDPIVVLHDAKTKRELVDLYADDTPGLQGDCRLTHTFKESGEILVEVRDTTHRGAGDYAYRLRIGEFPGATTAFPLVARVARKRRSVCRSGHDPGSERDAAEHPGLAAVYAVPWPGRPTAGPSSPPERQPDDHGTGTERRTGEGEQAPGAQGACRGGSTRRRTWTTSPLPGKRVRSSSFRR